MRPLRVCGTIILLVLGTCAGAAAPAAQGERPALYVLLADNRLLALGADGSEVFRLRLGPRERQPAIGPHLAVGPRGRLLYALVQGSARSGDSVVVVDTVRRAIASRIGLPRRTIFRVLALAPRTQRVFAVGDRPAQGPQEPVVAAVDTRRRRLLWSGVVHVSGGLDWWVYQAVVEPGEASLLVSYHGASTTGADRFVLRPRGVQPCARPAGTRAGLACISLHGRVEPYRGGLLAATGDPRAILVLDRDGHELRRLDPHLDGNHLMEFALDRGRGLLYSVGSCGYSGGLVELAVATNRVRLLEQPRNRRICGDRLVVLGSSLLAIDRTPLPIPGFGSGGAIQFVRRSDGALDYETPTPADAVDLVAVPKEGLAERRCADRSALLVPMLCPRSRP